MYTIVITAIRDKDTAEQVSYAAKMILSQQSSCPVKSPCLESACPVCTKEHIFVLHNNG